ncbi:ABC transporter permease [Nakamurella lactea]|uniref:ABC transporter permease n=1 Tax=Nakamurella lactea TaxID=459515 RepID=UPI00040EE49E|nr:ABC transporter permease subunit [Nakamurella lactea]
MSLWNSDFLPTLNVGQWFNNVVSWMNDNLGPLLNVIDDALTTLNDGLTDFLNWVPPLIMVLLLAGLGTWVRGWLFGLFAVIGLLLIQAMPTADLWPEAMESFALVLVAAVIAMILAIPIGILAASNGIASRIIRPVMDLMQTMPAYVYLVPALFFWSVGPTTGLVATIVFAMPPGVRLTELGIRQVDPEMVEAGHAFGAPRRQILRGIQFPLAMPTVMAGINQVIMLSLSMVVIAGLVGSGGLGEPVYQGISNLDLVTASEAGLAVVVLAIYLDRLTSAFGDKSAVARASRPRKKAAATA